MHSGLLIKVVSLAVAAGAIVLLARVSFEHPHVNDFRSFYAGATAASEHRLAGLYRDERTSRAPLELPFIRPPVYALLLEPLTYLAFAPAFWLWIALQSAIFLGCLYWAYSKTAMAAVACLFPPALLGIGHAQDCATYLAILIASYALFRKGRELPAGLVLGLGLLKFHLFLLWPVALILQKRWRALLGYCLTGAALVAGSVAAVGAKGIMDYCSLLADPGVAESTPGRAREVGIGSLLANLSVSSAALAILLGMAVAAVALCAVRRASIEWLFVILPAASLAAMPHALYYDPTMLLLSIWIALSLPATRLLHSVAMVLASPFVFSAVLLPPPWSTS